MVDNRQHARAEAFLALPGEGIFVLPNARDAGSAAMIAATVTVLLSEQGGGAVDDLIVS
jgi:hypothetical protein